MERRQPTTLKEVAERAGVSKMAASAALSGNMVHVRVSEATRARIVEVAAEMGYMPNAVARSLKRRSTHIIGMYCGYTYLNARHPFLGEIIGGAQEGCDTYHKDLLLHSVFRGLSVDDIYRELVDGRIDGLILNAAPNDPLVVRLAESRLPVVAVVDAVHRLPSVVADDADGSRRIVEFLAAQGHTRLLYRSKSGLPPLASVQRRQSAFLAHARERNLTVREWYAPELTDPSDPAAAPWLDEPVATRPTAAVCWNDLAAYDSLAQCHSRGLRVPHDLALIGFDGIYTPLGFLMPLTTIRAPWARVARTAVDLLVAQIGGAVIPQETVLPVEFVRGMTA